MENQPFGAGTGATPMGAEPAPQANPVPELAVPTAQPVMPVAQSDVPAAMPQSAPTLEPIPAAPVPPMMATPVPEPMPVQPEPQPISAPTPPVSVSEPATDALQQFEAPAEPTQVPVSGPLPQVSNEVSEPQPTEPSPLLSQPPAEPMLGQPSLQPQLDAPTSPLLGEMPPVGGQATPEDANTAVTAKFMGSSSSSPETQTMGGEQAAGTVSPDALLPKKQGFGAKLKEFLFKKR